MKAVPRDVCWLTLAAVLLATSCGPRAVDVSGTWEGRWTADEGSSIGGFEVVVEQRGTAIRGPISLSLDWLPRAAINGTVDGRRVRWGVLRGGVVALQFDGEVDGDAAQGRYTVATGGGGAWTARRIRR
jgi:hypothetical protein